MSGRAGALLLLLLCTLLACGGVQRRKVALDSERLTRARELKVELRAPELFARAEGARKDAEAAPEGSPARLDHTSEARLWLEAAIAEASRLELSEQRLALEQEVDAAEQGLIDLERERAELARKAELRAAAALAEAEAQRALERASTAPRLRPKLSKAEVTTAAQALLSRATLIQEALAAQGRDTSALTSTLAEARALLTRDPELALDRADAALSRALAALGALRASSGAPGPNEAASLAEALRETGARVARGDRGLSAVLEGAFAERSLKPAVRTRLARLCAVARGYPHGVRAAVGGSAAASQARARELAGELARAGCEGARFGVDTSPVAQDDLELTWLAY